MKTPQFSVLLAAVAVAAAVILTGCQTIYPPAPKPSANVQSADMRVTLAMRPAHPRQMDPVSFTVMAVDKEGKPVQNAHVSVELVMPFMEMGRNAVAFEPTGPDAYKGSGRFTMSGEWNVVVSVANGADKIVRPFPVRVR